MSETDSTTLEKTENQSNANSSVGIEFRADSTGDFVSITEGSDMSGDENGTDGTILSEVTNSKSRDQQRNSTSYSNPTLTEAAITESDAIRRENAELRCSLETLQSQVDFILNENNQLKSRLVDLSQEKEKELNHLKATCPQDSPPIDICFDKSQLFEEKSKLELDLVSKVKENASLKKKNLKLGELLIQRDAVILKQRKQLAQLTDRVQEYESSQIQCEELSRSIQTLKEESLHHSNELQQTRSSHLAVKQELMRCRQERESLEKEYFRVECALRKSNDSVVSLQQQLSDAVERRNSLSILVDDLKREVHLLESQNIDCNDKLNKLQLDYEVEVEKKSNL
ncbi:hypothetical protein JH06_2703 [Blastocystis sp. subtype 4]|uniref:hypothetical protein n=1 Tax=Blastocystis sp. subtype 4 TaxID=944170 RepID=UPI000711D11A|nr:hypothetical protein JH06_2703 [Blastocystis sp. subtype 4]KNB43450.1 hypothetical protein JH06_2703 [Blastocystis sp. subtype 4]|eukprot:XP_014526893.1 hypothetical protein JH06_2703 [Blastocystis sp. subtype 4]